MTQSGTQQRQPKKNPCPDCKMCQGCSETRCRACLSGRSSGTCGRLSVAEQIKLFDGLNPHLQQCCQDDESTVAEKPRFLP